jgi:nucleotide-binding universal stress UspA family protein
MARTDARPVVVGVDGSDGALDAVAWAAAEAVLHGGPLRIVHAFVWPLLKIPTALWHMGPERGLRAHADKILTDAEAIARAVAPDVAVDTAVSTQFPLPLLLEESRNAAYVVVGSSGLGPLGDSLAGSLTVDLVARSHAPVVLVRKTPPPDRTDQLVVVGVDGSPLAAAAVAVAMNEAALRGGRLLAVHVARRGPAAPLRRLLAGTPAKLTLMGNALHGWRRNYPDLPIEERVLIGHPAGALVDLSERATLVVVGSRGRGGFAGMLLGSVSQALLHHAQCPVIVVPSEVATPNVL